VICLAVGEAAGAAVERCLPAAAAVELAHTFSLVHDDLPALDDDDERRGQPSAHVAFGEAVALLAGDALLAEAFRLALSYPTPAVARELAGATLGMIGGQYRDVTGDTGDLAALHRLKTGCLFAASVGAALWVAEVSERAQAPWRAFGDELGLLFQIVDDVLDGDGYAAELGVEAARALADEAAARARDRLAAIPADTSVLADVVGGLAARTS
jgi:geranylgeranyl diphosphate synthase type II